MVDVDDLLSDEITETKEKSKKNNNLNEFEELATELKKHFKNSYHTSTTYYLSDIPNGFLDYAKESLSNLELKTDYSKDYPMVIVKRKGE